MTPSELSDLNKKLEDLHQSCENFLRLEHKIDVGFESKLLTEDTPDEEMIAGYRKAMIKKIIPRIKGFKRDLEIIIITNNMNKFEPPYKEELDYDKTSGKDLNCEIFIKLNSKRWGMFDISKPLKVTEIIGLDKEKPEDYDLFLEDKKITSDTIDLTSLDYHDFDEHHQDGDYSGGYDPDDTDNILPDSGFVTAKRFYTKKKKEIK